MFLPFFLVENMNFDNTRKIAENCFVCGSKNLFGLRIKFRLDGAICRAEFTPDERHQGYDNILRKTMNLSYFLLSFHAILFLYLLY